jgi:di/tricarboxylate transporter
LAKGNTAMIPLIIFVLTTVVTTIGPGNIAGTALMAPVAMAIAGRIGMSAFLMTLVVVGAANGAAFSPLAPTGIISNGIIAKMAPQLAAMGQNLGDLNTLAWKIHFNSEIAQGFANIGGFFVLGGWAWISKQRQSSLDIDEIAPKPSPYTSMQLATLAAIGALILLVILPGLPATKGLFSTTFLNVIGTGKGANVGAIAFLLSCVLLLINAGDSKAAVKAMPWSVIIMVCGMTVLIDVMDKAGGLGALVGMIAAVSTPTTINGVLGFVTGIISAYSSSSGVVMPMFLPMVPGLFKQMGGGSAVAMISSINVGAHLVDTSPLSTLGALCIACAAEHEDKGKLFKNLMIWGLSMSVVGALLCYVFFGLLGF